MSSSSGYPARWAAGRGWLGRALGSLLAGVRLRPRGSSAAQLSCPAQLPSSAAQLGWPAWLASISGQLGWVVWSATDPFRVRRGFFLGPWTGISFFPFSLVWGCNLFLGKKLRSETKASPRASRAGQPSCQPSWPAKLACQAGLPSWVRWLGRGSQAGELLVLPSRRGSQHGRATQPAGRYPLTDRSPLCGANLPTTGLVQKSHFTNNTVVH